jgi:hypothetical protein
MNKSNHHISTDDAKAALTSLEIAHKTMINGMRPPFWLTLLCAIALGIKTAAMGLMINNNLWHNIQWVSYIIIVLSIFSWIIALRIKGITIKITDVNIGTKGIVAALLICTLLAISRAIYLQTDIILFPYIAGILNALILAFSLHFNLRLNAKEQENNNE